MCAFPMVWMFSTLSFGVPSINFSDTFGTCFYRWTLLQGWHKLNKPLGNPWCTDSINNIDFNLFRSLSGFVHFSYSFSPQLFFLTYLNWDVLVWLQ